MALSCQDCSSAVESMLLQWRRDTHPRTKMIWGGSMKSCWSFRRCWAWTTGWSVKHYSTRYDHQRSSYADCSLRFRMHAAALQLILKITAVTPRHMNGALPNCRAMLGTARLAVMQRRSHRSGRTEACWRWSLTHQPAQIETLKSCLALPALLGHA